MDSQVLNDIVFYLWKKSQPTAMVVLIHEFQKSGINLNIMELEQELQSKDILLVSGGRTKMYSLSHKARIELQKMNPKNQKAMYEYLIEKNKSILKDRKEPEKDIPAFQAIELHVPPMRFETKDVKKSMFDWFRPFRAYRKYLLADFLLKSAANQMVIVESVNETETYQKAYLPYPVSGFKRLNSKYDPDRILEALDLLEENKHVILVRNVDIFKITFECTVHGESANHDGFYRSEAIKRQWKLIAGIFLGLSGIITVIVKMVT